MFGFVMADIKELSKEACTRYEGVYCGICRQIRQRSSNASRLGLSYDMAFLALLLMSLYEPQEQWGDRACKLHPIKPRKWVDNEFIGYSADMNVALAYYKALDDQADDHKLSAKFMGDIFGKNMPSIRERYPRQCKAIEDCMEELSRLEQNKCANPDEPAGCFGRLMGELFVYKEDHWSDTLRQMGQALGRFIYLADSALDYKEDLKKGRYNPFLEMGMEKDWKTWEDYLVLTMGRCTDHFEKLPLVQDKDILDNILYGGIWMMYRNRSKERKNDGRSL